MFETDKQKDIRIKEERLIGMFPDLFCFFMALPDPELCLLGKESLVAFTVFIDWLL